jgi:hypothetical protein
MQLIVLVPRVKLGGVAIDDSPPAGPRARHVYACTCKE